MTSTRLAVKFTTCTTTPRSGRKYVEELARTYDVSVHEHIYEEAKLALNGFDLNLARTLFEQCPSDYRNTLAYLEQCRKLEILCAEGVVCRPSTRELRCALTALFGGVPHQVAAQCAERLYAAGYSATAIQSATLWDFEDLNDTLSLSMGYRVRLQTALTSRTSLLDRACIGAARAVRRCGGVEECLTASVALVHKARK